MFSMFIVCWSHLSACFFKEKKPKKQRIVRPPGCSRVNLQKSSDKRSDQSWPKKCQNRNLTADTIWLISIPNQHPFPAVFKCKKLLNSNPQHGRKSNNWNPCFSKNNRNKTFSNVVFPKKYRGIHLFQLSNELIYKTKMRGRQAKWYYFKPKVMSFADQNGGESSLGQKVHGRQDKSAR